MKEILRDKIKECKAKYESRVYDMTKLELPKQKYFCGQGCCDYNPKLNELRIYSENGSIELYCVKCIKGFIKEEVINEVKWDAIELLYALWKEEYNE